VHRCRFSQEFAQAARAATGDEPFSRVHYFANATRREPSDAFRVAKYRRIILRFALITLGTQRLVDTIGIVNAAKWYAAWR